jgi:hypothetical protein
MDAHTLELLRRQQLVRRLADGREAVAVTLQYSGDVPPFSRAERRRWLSERFAELSDAMGGLAIEPETLSVSGQTVNAVIPVEDVERLRGQLSDTLRLDIPINRQIVDRG